MRSYECVQLNILTLVRSATLTLTHTKTVTLTLTLTFSLSVTVILQWKLFLITEFLSFLSLFPIFPALFLSLQVHLSVENSSATYYEMLRRRNYVTPTSYLELLSSFGKLIGERGERSVRSERGH